MATRFNALPVWEQNRQLDRIAAGEPCGDCFEGAVIGLALLKGITTAANEAGTAEGLDRPLLVDANFSGAHFTGDADFAGFEFRGGLRAAPNEVAGEDQPVIIEGNANLVGATIGGDALLSLAEIGGDAYLFGAEIGGAADLYGATIGGDANLVEATIEGDASLSRATIGGDANLSKATIGGDANLSKATIEGVAYLVGAKIGGDANLYGATIDRDADLYGATIGGDANLGGAKIGGDANLNGARIVGDAHLYGATIGGYAYLGGATIGGNANLGGATIEGNANLGGATIAGDANLSKANIEGNANLAGATIGGWAKLRETRVGGGLSFGGEVSGGVDATGLSVEGAAPDQTLQVGKEFVLDRARFAKEVRWELTLGTELTPGMKMSSAEGLRLGEGGQIIAAAGALDLSGATVGGPLEIAATGDGHESGRAPRLVSVERMDLSAPVTVVPGIDVRDCRFGRTPNLDQLRFAGTDQFHTHRRRQVIRAELDFRGHDPTGTDRVEDPDSAPIEDPDPAPDSGDGDTNAGGVAGEARDIAGVYRQLRTSMEATKDYPGASDFYYGEMEMRRSATWHTKGVRAKADWLIISVYRLISGYGLRAWRAFATFAVVVALGTLLFQFNDFSPKHEQLGYADTVVYALKSSISLLRPPADSELTFGEDLVQVTLRILAPALFALGMFALRARIRR